MEEFWRTLQNMLWNLTHRLGVLEILDILIVAVIIYELLLLTRRTRSSALLKGLAVLAVFALLSNLLGLTGLGWLLSTVLQNGALVLVVLFQPELRKALEKMGRSTLIRKGKHVAEDSETAYIISEITQTMLDLSRRKVGALIVFEQKIGLEDVIESGTRLDARISAPLLENIFEPNTPLHDGAVVIRKEKVTAAACILPLTEAAGVSRELGTRHRAGIGISENSDAIVLLVSEETGTMSVAKGGQITRYLNEKMLREILQRIFEPKYTGLGGLIRLARKTEGDRKHA